MCVPGAPILDRALEGVTDDLGRFEVRLAELEMDHVDAGPFELLGPFCHLDGKEGLDLLTPSGQDQCHLLMASSGPADGLERFATASPGRGARRRPCSQADRPSSRAPRRYDIRTRC